MTNEKAVLGNLIHQHEDHEGQICIYENNGLRYLTFGNQTEQSCLSLPKPHRLEHAYTQAMMLSLLFKADIRSTLLLGLGGGGLARALRYYRDKLKIDAVEYRQAVIDLAAEVFYLPDDSAFHAHCNDAFRFVATTDKSYDLIFSDLYLPDGMDRVQIKTEFLQNCKDGLNQNGILIVNLWSFDFQQTLKAQQRLLEAFDNQVLSFHVPGGNDIAFAFNNEMPNLEKKSFFVAAQQLGVSLDIPLQALARSFWTNNAQKLHLNRINQLHR